MDKNFGTLFVDKFPTKADASKSYVGLKIACGYRDFLVTADRALIAEWLDLSVKQLMELPFPVVVGVVKYPFK